MPGNFGRILYILSVLYVVYNFVNFRFTKLVGPVKDYPVTSTENPVDAAWTGYPV